MKCIVLSSSRGTTAHAVIKRLQEGSLTMECLGLIADKEGRGCIEKFAAASLPITIVPKKKGEEREVYDRRLHDAIVTAGGDPRDTVIAALGWMYIFSPWFTTTWEQRIINVHPSLLPKYPGAQAVQDTLDAGEQETGMTIHFIDDGVDTGPIILQKPCPVLEGDTVETLHARIQELEQEWYPTVLQMMEEGTIG